MVEMLENKGFYRTYYRTTVSKMGDDIRAIRLFQFGDNNKACILVQNPIFEIRFDSIC